MPADLPHSHALVFTVEMDKDMLDRAPRGPAIAESTQQYLNAAVIAVQAAIFLRSRGYAARAHIDADYRVVRRRHRLRPLRTGLPLFPP